MNRQSLLVSFVLAAVSAVANASLSEQISQLNQQLNVCRQEYKQMAVDAEKKLAFAQSNDPQQKTLRIYNRRYVEEVQEGLQRNLTEKAKECNKIKIAIADAPKKEAEKQRRKADEQRRQQAQIDSDNKMIQAIETAAPGEKRGPVLRCYQAGQSYQEFLKCSNKLGYKNTAIKKIYDSWAIMSANEFDDGIIGVVDSKTNRTMAIQILGLKFWGNTEGLTEKFIYALMDAYKLPPLEKTMRYATRTIETMRNDVYAVDDVSEVNKYEGQADGWSITINNGNPVLIEVMLTQQTDEFKF